MATSSDALTLCLVSDAEPVRAAVRVSCPPPHTVETFSLDGVLGTDHTVSGYGASVIQAARSADVVLVDWSMEQAALINMLCHTIRRADSFVPVIALCSGGQDETIAALAAGADDVAGFPLRVPLLQARIAAYRRLVRVVQRATSARLKKTLTRGRQKAARDAETDREERAGHPEADVERETGDRRRTDEGAVETLAEALTQGVQEALALVDPDDDVTHVGALRLDRTAYRVHAGEREIELTPKEFELLGFLMERAGELCTRDQILDRVWGINFDTGTNMVDVYMHFLRKKLAARGLGSVLQTVRGRGYRLVAPDARTT